MMMTGMVITSV